MYPIHISYQLNYNLYNKIKRIRKPKGRGKNAMMYDNKRRVINATIITFIYP